MAKLIHNDPGASCSFDGVEYVPDGDGVIEVPDAAVGDLRAFGFVIAPVVAPQEKKSKKKE